MEQAVDAAEEKVRVARLSVYSNSFLVALKLLVGVFMGSVSVISEAIHSGIDLLAALLARFSVKMSGRPADEDHRYGHGKFENLSGMIEGALILVAAAVILYESGKRLFDGYEIGYIWFGMVVMAISAVVNLVVSSKLMKVAKRTDSLALEADAYHLRADVWTSAGVFAALALIYLTGMNEIDPIIAIVVAAFIIRAAFDITKRSTHGLLDTTLPEREIQTIERIMNEHHDRFVDFHRLRARKTGSERQIDLHITVPHDLNVKESHELVDHLEREIRKELPGSVVVMHIEPCDENCEKCRMRGSTESLLRPRKT